MSARKKPHGVKGKDRQYTRTPSMLKTRMIEQQSMTTPARIDALTVEQSLKKPSPTEPKLIVELVPSTAWGKNVRSMLTKAAWDRLRRGCYRWAKYKCEICGGEGKNHPVDCHEVWAYDDDKGIQRLTRLIALCPDCHTVKHFMLAEKMGKGAEALKHLSEVNGWTPEEAKAHVEEARKVWRKRSRRKWRLDTSILTG